MVPPGQLAASVRPAALAWPALVIVASVTGGLAAVAVDGGRVSLTVGIAISVVIGLAIAGAALRWMVVAGSPHAALHRERHRGTPNRQRSDGPKPPDADGGGMAADDTADPDVHVRVLPVTGPAAHVSSWWLKPGKVPSGARSASGLVRAREFSSYLDSALIAACPRCGAFDLSAAEATANWAFRCRSCQHDWTWQPGTPWPAVQVRPRLRTGASRSGRAPGRA